MSARILVVEDHPASRKLTAYLLEKSGFEVRVADCGEEALELTEHEAFDLILCDIHMPGIDGYEVAQRLKGDPKYNRIPLVAMTALVGAGHAENLLAAGFDGVVLKDIGPKCFVQQVQSFLLSSDLESLNLEGRSSPDGLK